MIDSKEKIEDSKKIKYSKIETRAINSCNYFEKALHNKTLDIDSIPRPKHTDEYFINKDKTNIFKTLIGENPPQTNSFHIVDEIENSSSRFIRGSLIKVPLDQEILNKSSIILGITT